MIDPFLNFPANKNYVSLVWLYSAPRPCMIDEFLDGHSQIP